ncbi:MAG: hypothetical protein ACK5YO_00425 [Planctomyces sp.]
MKPAYRPIWKQAPSQQSLQTPHLSHLSHPLEFITEQCGETLRGNPFKSKNFEKLFHRRITTPNVVSLLAQIPDNRCRLANFPPAEFPTDSRPGQLASGCSVSPLIQPKGAPKLKL